MILTKCPCGSLSTYLKCCKPFHQKKALAPTAEILMRSRYSAFVIADHDYLFETTHPSKRKNNSKKAYSSGAKNINWIKLEILLSSFDVVEFKAYYFNNRFEMEILHERSRFKLEDGKWYYVDGTFLTTS